MANAVICVDLSHYQRGFTIFRSSKTAVVLA